MMPDELKANVFEVKGWGWVGLVASERGIRALVLPRPSREAALTAVRKLYTDVAVTQDDPFLRDVAGQVTAYLEGEQREFSVAVDLRGHTSFALAVWAAAARVGYGETRSYRWIAEQTGSPAGAGIYQAVGSALGDNPVPLIIPCHRVIGSDGSLHGYAGGLDMKQRLLAMETGQGRLALP